jgi:PTS system mannose-specific IIA component
VVEVNDGDGVVILTDILGGTPTNVSLPLLEKEKVEIMTGVNMPMLLTLSSCRKGRSCKEIVPHDDDPLYQSFWLAIRFVSMIIGGAGSKGLIFLCITKRSSY